MIFLSKPVTNQGVNLVQAVPSDMYSTKYRRSASSDRPKPNLLLRYREFTIHGRSQQKKTILFLIMLKCSYMKLIVSKIISHQINCINHVNHSESIILMLHVWYLFRLHKMQDRYCRIYIYIIYAYMYRKW